MELETPLPPETPSAGPESQPGGRTVGLAAAVANEHSQDAGNVTNSESPLGPPRRIGRPPVQGRYSKAAGSDGKSPAPLPGSEPLPAFESALEPETRVVIPPDLLSEVVQESLRLAETFASNKIEG